MRRLGQARARPPARSARRSRATTSSPTTTSTIDGKILKKTPKAMRGGAFFELTVRAGGGGHRLHAAGLPAAAALRAAPRPGRRRLPGRRQEQGDQEDQRAQPAAPDRDRREDHRASVNGKELASVDDTNPGAGARAARSASRSATRSRRARRWSATFKRVAVAVPTPRRRRGGSPISTETLERPRTGGPGSGLGGNWQVIVLNDDHNTFDHVARTLARGDPGRHRSTAATGSPSRSTARGRAIVWTGPKEPAELYWEQLERRRPDDGAAREPLRAGPSPAGDRWARCGEVSAAGWRSSRRASRRPRASRGDPQHRDARLAPAQLRGAQLEHRSQLVGAAERVGDHVAARRARSGREQSALDLGAEHRRRRGDRGVALGEPGDAPSRSASVRSMRRIVIAGVESFVSSAHLARLRCFERLTFRRSSVSRRWH